MCGALGTAAGLVFFLVCPLMMIGMMVMVFLVVPRLMRGRAGGMMCRRDVHDPGDMEERSTSN
jgi:hypothetical protein